MYKLARDKYTFWFGNVFCSDKVFDRGQLDLSVKYFSFYTKYKINLVVTKLKNNLKAKTIDY